MSINPEPTPSNITVEADAVFTTAEWELITDLMNKAEAGPLSDDQKAKLDNAKIRAQTFNKRLVNFLHSYVSSTGVETLTLQLVYPRKFAAAAAGVGLPTTICLLEKTPAGGKPIQSLLNFITSSVSSLSTAITTTVTELLNERARQEQEIASLQERTDQLSNLLRDAGDEVMGFNPIKNWRNQ